MRLPMARGRLSAILFPCLRRGQVPEAQVHVLPSGDEDRHIALWALYELSYRGFEDVAPCLESVPAVCAIRKDLEDAFEAELRQAARTALRGLDPGDGFVAALERITSREMPSLADYIHRHADLEQFCEFLVLRSIYQLKEADPHAFLLPRLEGAAKVALAEILYDEYGDGCPERNHQFLFANALQACDLNSDYGHYIEQAPASVVASSNAMSLFCFNRRLLAAGAGHLAALEMTSSVPSRRIVQGAERLGVPPAAIRYFDEHIEADAVHEQVAARGLCGGLIEADPSHLQDVLFGAAVAVQSEAAMADAALGAWRVGASALRR